MGFFPGAGGPGAGRPPGRHIVFFFLNLQKRGSMFRPSHPHYPPQAQGPGHPRSSGERRAMMRSLIADPRYERRDGRARAREPLRVPPPARRECVFNVEAGMPCRIADVAINRRTSSRVAASPDSQRKRGR